MLQWDQMKDILHLKPTPEEKDSMKDDFHAHALTAALLKGKISPNDYSERMESLGRLDLNSLAINHDRNMKTPVLKIIARELFG